MKKYLYVILLLMIPIVFATIEECQRVQLSSNVPCTIISSFKPDVGCEQEVTIFLENGSLIQNQSWQNSTPFCQFQWNITSPLGTYVYNSSIEDGVITMEAQDNMLAITFVFIIFILYFSGIGWINSQRGRRLTSFLSYFLGLVELFILAGLVWMNEAGNSLIPILKLNFTIFLLLGGGLLIFTLFTRSLNMVNVTEELTDGEDWESKSWIDPPR